VSSGTKGVGFYECDQPAPSARLIARNALWNLAGYATPLIAAVVVIPILIRSLGTARYGVLTIAWGMVGYFGFFDIGLDNALTKLIAERIGKGSEAIRDLIYTGFVIMAATGITGGIILAALSHSLAYSWFRVPSALAHETALVFCIFSVALPFVITSSCFRGTLAAYQRFDLINRVQIAAGLFSFLSPVAVLLFSHSLVYIVGALVIGKVLAWCAYLWMCFQVEPSLSYLLRPRWKTVRPLVTFGGWMSLSAIIDPIFLYSDRFVLAAVASVSAVAYYATPFDMVVRLWLIPDALNAALFPNYAATLGEGREVAISLLEKAGNYLFPAILAPVLVIILFPREILSVWISQTFALHSARVLALLAFGVFLNSIARIPWTLLVACRPDLPAKLVLVEAPGYLAVLYFLTRSFGLEGAGMAWVLRMSVNCLVLHVMTWRLLPDARKAIRKNALMAAISIAVLAVAGMLFEASVAARCLYLLFGLTGALLTIWFCLISPDERTEMVAVFSPSRS
jgi:O-antigen/teichoic acid export membrane protein